MLLIEHISVGYNGNTVLENLGCSFDAGQIHGIIGLNGQGKTTFLNSISRLLSLTHGTITFDNRPIFPTDVAFLQTDIFFYPLITGEEYLSLMSKHNPQFNLDKWNQVFHLPLKDLMTGYSAGMKKKLAFIGIIALDRPIIILDEPFNNLDIEANRLFVAIIKQLAAKGKIILITSHVIEPLLAVCDTIDWLSNKTIRHRFQHSDFNTIEEIVFANIHIEEMKLIGELI
jgi:ABC-2 type transport system ATP-binding protein